MDDILIARSNSTILLQIFGDLKVCLKDHGLITAPEKVQHQAPFQYLGQLIDGCTVKPQKVQILIDCLHSMTFKNYLEKSTGYVPHLNLLQVSLALCLTSLKEIPNPPQPDLLHLRLVLPLL